MNLPKFLVLKKGNKRQLALACALYAAISTALLLGYGKSYISVAYDRHVEDCLPEVKVALLVHYKPDSIADGDYVFFTPSKQGALSYITEKYVMKKVAGVAGDTLEVNEEGVWINQSLIVEGLANAKEIYQQEPAFFFKKEVIPQGKLFLVGTHPKSNDSRYWGYLNSDRVLGHAYKLF